jgi:adenine phosphoribosyltransferase
MAVTTSPAQCTQVTPEDIEKAIRNVPNFPKAGINFKDITTVLNQPELFAGVIDWMAAQIGGQPVDAVVGIESRGFMLGAALAYKLGCGFVPIRKKGKLPGKTVSQTYELEYGEDTVEVHTDAVPAGGRVVLVDDLLATGGTMAASMALLGQLDVQLVRILFMVDLTFLDGRKKIDAAAQTLALPAELPIQAMVAYHD